MPVAQTSTLSKFCSRCQLDQPFDMFHRSSKSSDGRQGYCKSCVVQYQRDNAEAVRAHGRKWYHDNKGKDKIRDTRLQRLYGISLVEYRRKYNKQNGVCAICKGINDDGSDLAVDHDHETGEVRELLCRACNLMIKSERPSILEAGARYLRRFGKED